MNGYQLLCKTVENNFLPSYRLVQLKMDLLTEAQSASDDESNSETTLNKQYQMANVANRISCSCPLLSQTFEELSLPSNLNIFETLIDASAVFVKQNVCAVSEVKTWVESLQTSFRNLMLEKDLRGSGQKIELEPDQLEYRKEVLAKVEAFLRTITNIANRSEL